ncbi:MAG: HAD family phosphatase [Clostridiales bacterium]|nr:HAD family phosphatase [Clostridiales bacterium]
MIRLIVSDVDGTLLQNGETALSEKMLDIIRRMTGRGVPFAVASGRAYHDLKLLFRPVFDRVVFVCHDGALMMHRNCTLMKAPLKREAALRTADRMLAEKNCNIVLSGRERSYYIERTKEFGENIRTAYGSSAVKVQAPYEVGEEILKLGFFRAGESRTLLKQLSGYEEDGMRVAYQDSGWVELVAQGVHKGSTVRALGQKFGIPMEQVMAFGDNDNDVELLKTVGHPIAIRRGKQTAKDVSAEVVERVEDVLGPLYG